MQLHTPAPSGTGSRAPGRPVGAPTGTGDAAATTGGGAGATGDGKDGIVLVPTAGRWRPGAGDPHLRLGQASDGSPVALAYSSAATLSAAHGEHPWIAVRRAELFEALRPLGVRRFLIDGHEVRSDG